LIALFLALALPALLAVLVVLWRAQRPQPRAEDAALDADWALMVQRRREIDEDPDLDPALRETLIAEWQEQAAALRAPEPATAPATGAGVAARRLWLLPLAVVVTAVAAYATVGNLSEPALRVQLAGWNQPARPAGADAGEDLPVDSDTLQQRIADLEKRLQAQPDDAEGWVMLARSRGLQGDYPAAVKALEQALRLTPDQPDLLADLADATAMAQGEKMGGRPVELVAQALKIDPRHPKSLALAATAAMQAGQRDNAIKLWRTLQSQFQPGDPSYQQIAGILAQLDEPAPGTPDSGTPGGAASAQPTPAPAGRAAADAAHSASVRGEVSLAPAALERLRQQPAPASAVLYVVAKAVDGPPMPLAVLRLPITELVAGRPLAFQLDDSLAMSPQLKLSQFRQVSVEARLSMSGNAIRQSEDWSAVRSPVAVGSAGLSLRIEPAAAGR